MTFFTKNTSHHNRMIYHAVSQFCHFLPRHPNSVIFHLVCASPNHIKSYHLARHITRHRARLRNRIPIWVPFYLAWGPASRVTGRIFKLCVQNIIIFVIVCCVLWLWCRYFILKECYELILKKH